MLLAYIKRNGRDHKDLWEAVSQYDIDISAGIGCDGGGERLRYRSAILLAAHQPGRVSHASTSIMNAIISSSSSPQVETTQ